MPWVPVTDGGSVCHDCEIFFMKNVVLKCVFSGVGDLLL